MTLAFADESGKNSPGKVFILVAVTLEEQAAKEYENRIWEWGEREENWHGQEIKLRHLLKRLGDRKAAIKLDGWKAIVAESHFKWFVILTNPAKGLRYAGLDFSADKFAATVATQQMANILSDTGANGTIILDNNIADLYIQKYTYESKLMLRDRLGLGRMVNMRRVVGQVTNTDSQYLPELWLADGIAYLLDQWINRRKWYRRFDDVWGPIREKVWRSGEDEITGWGLRVYPQDDDLEALALQKLMQ